MNARSLFLAGALCAVPFLAQADDVRLPAGAPASFAAECAACHVAYPPQLLDADGWRRVMATLDKHYGDNATLDEKTRREIEAFLVGYAGKPSKVGAGKTAGEPPRLTETPWFKREHRKVARADWSHPKVKSPANCAACHTRAAEGSYRERDIAMPDGRKWED